MPWKAGEKRRLGVSYRFMGVKLYENLYAK